MGRKGVLCFVFFFSFFFFLSFFFPSILSSQKILKKLEIQYIETLIYKGGDPAFKQIDAADEYIFVSMTGVVDILRSERGVKVVFGFLSLSFSLSLYLSPSLSLTYMCSTGPPQKLNKQI